MAGPTARKPADNDESKPPVLVEKWQVHASNGALYGFAHANRNDAVAALEAAQLPGAYLSRVYQPGKAE